MNKRNNYFSKPRRSRNMWVIYVKLPGEKLFFPEVGLAGRWFPSKSTAKLALRDRKQRYGERNAYLQKVGPIS